MTNQERPTKEEVERWGQDVEVCDRCGMDHERDAGVVCIAFDLERLARAYLELLEDEKASDEAFAEQNRLWSEAVKENARLQEERDGLIRQRDQEWQRRKEVK